jgi:hypothetical protein
MLLDSERNQSLLVYLGKIAIKARDKPPKTRNFNQILSGYGIGRTSESTLALRLLAAFQFFKINTAGTFATQI